LTIFYLALKRILLRGRYILPLTGHSNFAFCNLVHFGKERLLVVRIGTGVGHAAAADTRLRDQRSIAVRFKAAVAAACGLATHKAIQLVGRPFFMGSGL
jgi:hypothetical protein